MASRWSGDRSGGADMDDDRSGGASIRRDDRGGGAGLPREVAEKQDKIIDKETFNDDVQEALDVPISVAVEDDSSQDDLKVETVGGMKVSQWLALRRNTLDKDVKQILEDLDEDDNDGDGQGLR